MINKNSLLDAYIALAGSQFTHIAMFISLLAFVKFPGDLEDTEEYKHKLY